MRVASPAEGRLPSGPRVLVRALGGTGLLDAACTLVAAGILALYFIGLSPFSDLGDKRLLEVVQTSDALVNAIFISTTLIAAGCATLRDPRGFLALVRRPLVLMVGWLAFTAVISPDASYAVRRLVLALITFSLAAAVPLLARDLRQLAGLLLVLAGAALGLSWVGVALAPNLTIHQATDVGEIGLAGAWRGIYGHKNVAGPVMVMFVVVGLYVARARNRVAGLLLAAGAALFLPMTQAKSAIALCVAVLAVSFLIDRARSFRMRALLAFVPLIVLNALSVGTVISPVLHGILTLLPVDATFTGRADVWELATSAVAERPILGHGFQSFWGSVAVVFGSDDPTSWAEMASTSHNAHLEVALGAGLPGLGLMLAAFCWVPLRDFEARTRDAGAGDAFALFCLRLWLFGLYLASFEAIILNRVDPSWFAFALGVCGLRYASAFRLRA